MFTFHDESDETNSLHCFRLSVLHAPSSSTCPVYRYRPRPAHPARRPRPPPTPSLGPPHPLRVIIAFKVLISSRSPRRFFMAVGGRKSPAPGRLRVGQRRPPSSVSVSFWLASRRWTVGLRARFPATPASAFPNRNRRANASEEPSKSCVRAPQHRSALTRPRMTRARGWGRR